MAQQNSLDKQPRESSSETLKTIATDQVDNKKAEARAKFALERQKRHIYRIEAERNLKSVAYINWHSTKWPQSCMKLVKAHKNIWTLPKRPVDLLNFLYP